MTVLLPAARHAVQVPVAQAARPPQRMGAWTPDVGLRIAQRAAKWLGWPYSFGAGGTDGPSFGHAVDADSRNDGKVFGFDCSGLAVYALGPWRSLPHSAAEQYHAARSYHPPPDPAPTR